jgi:hypothetical protein
MTARPPASIEDFAIKDLDSFNRTTRRPYQIAGLYFYQVLDCLVELAYKVSCDFFTRPHLYLELNGIAPTLARLRSQLGCHEDLLDKQQREAIYAPLFGAVESPSRAESFPMLKEHLVQAAAAFSERVFDTGVEMLRERVRTAHRPFREFLTGLNGDSVAWSKERSLPVLTEEVCYRIFRNEGVASVFGISKPPSSRWPYDFDSNGEKLVSEISTKLSGEGETPLSRERFTSLQRTALKGAEAISTVVEFDETKYGDRDLDRLITKCYTWGSALMGIAGSQRVTDWRLDGSLHGARR